MNAGSVHRLLSVPHSFVQDPLMSSSEFTSAAKARGLELGPDVLGRLHECGLLVPFYLVVDDASDERRLPVGERVIGANPTGWAFKAANEGQLLDPAMLPLPDRSAYDRPAGSTGSDWWDGYLFSPWQLLEIPRALGLLGYVESGPPIVDFEPGVVGAQSRQLASFLAAAAPRALPGIVGRLTLPPGGDDESYREETQRTNVEEIVAISGYLPSEIAAKGELLLSLARADDPMIEWWPLMRHSDLSGWAKLRGEPLNCVWRRIGAEIVFRCHEELAERQFVDPLPEIGGLMAWTPLHDRITRRDSEVESLGTALLRVGLAPNPRVLMMVEGDSETLVFRRLLAELGLDNPRYVEVFNSKSSKTNPHLIARYVTSPRLGRVISQTQLVDGRPTVLVVVMDPEHEYATETTRYGMRTRIRRAIRTDVEERGGSLTDVELDFLFQLHTWERLTFELSNFGDDALVLAISAILESDPSRALTPSRESALRDALALSRSGDDPGLKDIDHVVGRALRLQVNKVRLAEGLLPDLLARLAQELPMESPPTPAIRILKEVRRLVGLLSGGGYALTTPAHEAEE